MRKFNKKVCKFDKKVRKCEENVKKKRPKCEEKDLNSIKKKHWGATPVAPLWVLPL